MLIYSGKALTDRIVSFKASNAERRQELHTLACSAVRLAARAGRANWLNLLNDALDQLEQNALQSWFATNNKNPVWGTVPWIAYDRRDGYTVIQGTEKVRPSDREIMAIEADISRAFVHKSAANVARDNGWNTRLIAAANGFVKAMERANKEAGNVIPRHMFIEAENLAKSVSVQFSNEKLGIAKPLPAGALTDEQIEELANKMEQPDIPAPHITEAEKPAEAKRAGGRRAAH